MLTASTTAWLVMVAPVTASMPSPSATGALFPINCSVNAGSAHLLPRPAVWLAASTSSAVMVFASSVVTFTPIRVPSMPYMNGATFV